MDKKKIVQVRVVKNSTQYGFGSEEFRIPLAFQVLEKSPQAIYDVLYHEKLQNTILSGSLQLSVRCGVVSFHVHYGVHEHLDRRGNQLQGVANEILAIVESVWKTMAWGQVHVDEYRNALVANTKIQYEYKSKVQWNVPNLRMALMTQDGRHKMMDAGFHPFLLGHGKTNMSVFGAVYTHQVDHLKKMIQTVLSGRDYHVMVSGDSNIDNCVAQKVLNLIHVPITVPGTYDGKPIILLQSSVQIIPKSMHLKSKTCRIDAMVQLTLRNPLPVDFRIRQFQFDAYFYNRSSKPTQKDYLFDQVVSKTAMHWQAHSNRTVSFTAILKKFSNCRKIILYTVEHALGIDIQHGRLQVSIDEKINFTVPFAIPAIPAGFQIK